MIGCVKTLPYTPHNCDISNAWWGHCHFSAHPFERCLNYITGIQHRRRHIFGSASAGRRQKSLHVWRARGGPVMVTPPPRRMAIARRFSALLVSGCIVFVVHLLVLCRDALSARSVGCCEEAGVVEALALQHIDGHHRRTRNKSSTKRDWGT